MKSEVVLCLVSALVLLIIALFCGLVGLGQWINFARLHERDRDRLRAAIRAIPTSAAFLVSAMGVGFFLVNLKEIFFKWAGIK